MSSRKWLRRLGVATALLSLLVLGAATVLRWRGAARLDRAARDFEARVGPLDLGRYNLPPVNPETNPARSLRHATELLASAVEPQPGRPPVMAALRELASRPAVEWSAEERQKLVEVLATTQAAREELRRASGQRGPSSFELDATRAWDLDLPDFRVVNGLGDLLIVEARQAHQAGDLGAVTRLAEELGSLAATLHAEAPLIFQFIAYSFERRQHVVLRLVAESPAADLGLIDACERALGEGPRAEDLVRTIGGEGAFLHLAFQDPKLRSSLAASPLERASLWVFGDDYLADGLDFYADSMDQLETSVSPGTEVWAAAPRQRPFWPADAQGFMLEFEPVALRLAATASTVRLARAALALRRAGLESGTYPPTTDPTPSELTGRPIRRIDHPDGRVTLDLEGAAERWDRLMEPRPNARRLLPAEWTLPPPPALTPRSAPAPAAAR